MKEFRPACRYKILNGVPTDFTVLDAGLWKTSGVVYARISEENIPVYIGSTDRTLQTRIMEHLNLIKRPINDAYRAWAEGKTITIVAYQPPPVELMGRPLSTHRMLESALIAQHKPQFVKRAP